MELGQKIRARRNQLGLRQSDVAKLIGTSTGMISQYEASGAMPSGAKLIEIAKALRVNVEWLIGPATKNFHDEAVNTTQQIVKAPLKSDTQAGDQLSTVMEDVKLLSPRSLRVLAKTIEALKEEDRIAAEAHDFGGPKD